MSGRLPRQCHRLVPDPLAICSPANAADCPRPYRDVQLRQCRRLAHDPRAIGGFVYGVGLFGLFFHCCSIVRRCCFLLADLPLGCCPSYCSCYCFGLFLLDLSMQDHRQNKEDHQGNILDKTVNTCQIIDNTIAKPRPHHRQENEKQPNAINKTMKKRPAP